jgi:hypothetical protein
MNKNLWDELEISINLSRVDRDAVARLVSRPIIEPPLFPLGGYGAWEGDDGRQ